MEETAGRDGPPPDDRPAGGVPGRVVLVVAAVLTTLLVVWGLDVLKSAHEGPLPGTALEVRVDPGVIAGKGCDTAGLAPTRLAVQGSALVLVRAAGGGVVDVTWPSGFAARLVGGRGELFDGAGYVVAIEGDLLNERLSGSAGPDGVFHVCAIARD